MSNSKPVVYYRYGLFPIPATGRSARLFLSDDSPRGSRTSVDVGPVVLHRVEAGEIETKDCIYKHLQPEAVTDDSVV